MNQNFGLIGKKLGNTQIFTEDGNVLRVTAILVGPCTVLGKRTKEKDGYSAVILGFGERSAKHVRKSQKAFYDKLGAKAARTVREIRVPEDKLTQFEVGQTVKPSEHFQVGQKVDVCGTTRGRGFTGVMRRWNFKGAGTDTHGTHEYRRHGGAVGTNMTPGRTLPNLKMPGQYGNERMTVLNLKVAKVLDDEQILLIEGAVPGARNAVVTVRGAVKARRPAA
ncbi:MAG: 50S ribosomal protein L3 [Polyangiales bacterium]